MSPDECAIRDLVAAWMQGSREGDAPRVLSLMTDDAVFLVPGRPPFGRAEFAAAFADMGDMRIEGHSEIEELQIVGEVAYMRSRLTVTATQPTGAPVLRAGYALTIVRRETDGQWRIARDANLLSIVPAT